MNIQVSPPPPREDEGEEDSMENSISALSGIEQSISRSAYSGYSEISPDEKESKKGSDEEVSNEYTLIVHQDLFLGEFHS